MDALVEIKQVIPNAEIKSASEPDEKRDKCRVILTQGKNKGELCNRVCKYGSSFCAAHHISAEREGSKLRENLYEDSDEEPVYNKSEEHLFEGIPNKDLRDLIDHSTKQVDIALENNTEHLKQVEKVLKLKILESLIDLAKLIL